VDQRTLSRKGKYNLSNGREYLQTMYLIRVLYPVYINNSYNFTTKRQPNEKMNKGLE